MTEPNLQPTLCGALVQLRPVRPDDWAPKPLMLDQIFQFVDSVIFMAGVSNFRSQRAMEKIGGRKPWT